MSQHEAWLTAVIVTGVIFIIIFWGIVPRKINSKQLGREAKLKAWKNATNWVAYFILTCALATLIHSIISIVTTPNNIHNPHARSINMPTIDFSKINTGDYLVMNDVRERGAYETVRVLAAHGGNSVVIDRIHYTAMSNYPTRAVLINDTENGGYFVAETATRDTRANGTGFVWDERMNVVALFPSDEERNAKKHTWALNQFKEISDTQFFVAPEKLTRVQRLTVLKRLRDTRQEKLDTLEREYSILSEIADSYIQAEQSKLAVFTSDTGLGEFVMLEAPAQYQEAIDHLNIGFFIGEGVEFTLTSDKGTRRTGIITGKENGNLTIADTNGNKAGTFTSVVREYECPICEGYESENDFHDADECDGISHRIEIEYVNSNGDIEGTVEAFSVIPAGAVDKVQEWGEFVERQENVFKTFRVGFPIGEQAFKFKLQDGADEVIYRWLNKPWKVPRTVTALCETAKKALQREFESERATIMNRDDKLFKASVILGEYERRLWEDANPLKDYM